MKIKLNFVVLLFLVLLSSCGSKKLTAEKEINRKLSAQQVIENHQKNVFQCRTLSGNISVDFKDANESKGLTLSFRMEKDKAIWLSAPLGLAKIYITPEKVQFYNKLEKTYFDGDFQYLTELIGIALSFESLQNLILGQTLYLLETNEYDYELGQDFYIFKSQGEQKSLKDIYALAPGHFQVAFFEINDLDKGRRASARYTYQQINNQVFPSMIEIVTREGNDQKNISLDFKSIECGEELRFPFNIPSGYKNVLEK